MHAARSSATASKAKRATSARCMAASRCRWRSRGQPFARAVRAAVRRRDDGHGARRRPRRAQRRVPAVAGDRARRPARTSVRDRRRHRRRRRPGGDRRRDRSRPTRWRAPGRRASRPRDALADNDGHGFFEALGDAVVTGPDAAPTSTTSARSSCARRPGSVGARGTGRAMRFGAELMRQADDLARFTEDAPRITRTYLSEQHGRPAST